MLDTIGEWWQAIGCAHSVYFPLLPRVITAGKTVGFVNDGRFSLGASSVSDHVMSIFGTSRRFRWLALHLMDTVSLRLGLRNFGEQFDYRLIDYYPLEEYLKEIQGVAFFLGRTTGSEPEERRASAPDSGLPDAAADSRNTSNSTKS
jgi:hypothetical protein